MNDTANTRVDNGPKSLLFGQIKFHIFTTEDFGDESANEYSRVLTEQGAEEISRCSTDEKAQTLDRITHIISTTSDFPEYETAKNAMIPVAKPEWVDACVARGRLANSRQYSPDPRLFFSGVVVCCADIPEGDKDAIIGGVLAMGGLYTGLVSKLVTHIVALTLEADQCQVATRRLDCKIVLPHWFDDCLKLGKRIDEAPYCLPNPEILSKNAEDRVPEAARKDMEGASSARPNRLPTPMSSPSANRRQLVVFKNKRVMLSPDLAIGSRLRGIIEDLIVDGGGNVTASVHKADIFVCQYRESMDYRIASRAGRDVGNLSWLYHLLTTNKWTSPMNRLLHYPISKNGLPGFKDFRISLSNYNGEARVYLENLAIAAGGEFTKTMKEDNTHLITAHLISEKCDAAKEWNINIVNHLWLEESYAKWQIQTLANPRYSHFPPRTNLGEVVGRTPVDRQAVERDFFPEGSDSAQTTTMEAGLRTLRVNDQSMNPPKASNTGALPRSSSTRAPEIVPFQNLPSAGATPKTGRGRPRGSNELQTPVPSRFANEEKENNTPSTTGSRGAKEKAAAKLHDMAPDIALFEKEMKRVGGVMHGKRGSPSEKTANNTRKRSISNDDETDTEVEEGRSAKKSKKPRIASPSMRLLLTADHRWNDQPKKESEEVTRLRELGIVITKAYTACTHLAAPKVARTRNFVCALAHGPMVLKSEYIEQCLLSDKKLDPSQFLLKETAEDISRGYKLADSVRRAKENKGRLLRGYTIWCTENIHGGFDAYKEIISANGGTCQLYRARPTSIAAAARAGAIDADSEDTGPSTPAYLYLVSNNSPEDVKFWPKFRQMAQEKGKIPRIVKNDWVLDLAIRQEIRWLDEYEY